MHMILADALRKAVLQAAIQGKLTQRMSSDSDVDALLKKIHEEKAILAEKKNSRKDKEFEEISESEIEFDIPDSWRWIRVGDIGVYKKGPFGSSLTKSMFVPKGPNSVKVYEQKNAIQKDASLGEYYITREYYDEKMSGFRVESGDIIVSCAGTIGETYVMPEKIELGIINQALMRMNIAESINLDYFLYYFDHVLKSNAKKSSNGSAIKNIPPFDVFKKMLFPVPPIEEQQRIVEKLNRILSEIDEYSFAEQELIALQSSFPDDMHKSVLQYAMQGKLVEQRPEEGTGEELYQQIQTAKENFIKTGRIKKEKPLPEITDEDALFDIPDSWKWVYVGDIFEHNTGKAQNASGSSDGKIRKFITTSNIYWNTFDFTKVKEMPFTEQELERCTVRKGDLLVCEGGDYGRSAIWNFDEEVCIQNHVHRLRPYVEMNIKFFYYLFYLYKNSGWLKGKGIAIQGLSSKAMHVVKFPLPPIKEQHRIVKKIEQILPHIEEFKEAI